MRSVMKHNFNQIPDVKLSRSVFDRSQGLKTTFDAGYLIPILCEEILPGDTVNLRSTFFARLATPLTPFMDNLFLDSFAFFVPNRLVWDNWQRFYGEQDDPGDSTDFNVPVFDVSKAPLNTTGYLEGSLSDYLGLPTKVTGMTHISLYHRAYNLIWNTHFRDENLQNSVVVDKDDGSDDPADYVLLKRGKRKDYFTSALPWPQKPFAGITDVTLPLGSVAPVISTNAPVWMHTLGAGADDRNLMSSVGSDDVVINSNWSETANLAFSKVADKTFTGLQTDLSNATAATINSLRQSFQIQRYLEQMARGGSRYIERLRVEFQVTSPDARLQRPELLSLGSMAINVHPIANTTGVKAANSPTAADKFQGDLSAMATVSGSAGVSKSFVEHGMLIMLVSVRADLTYCQGLDKKFTRDTCFDYYHPVFNNLGEQAILRKELFCNGVPADDNDVWGYIPRYDEYRHGKSQLTGLYRHNATGTLNIWHLSQILSATTDLNGAFIAEDPPIDRVISVPTQPHFLFDCFHKLIHVRAMSTNSVPGLIDHL